MIDFNCSKCGGGMSVPVSLAGRSETCPHCRNQVIIPTDLSGKVPTRKCGPGTPGEQSNRQRSAPFFLVLLVLAVGLGVGIGGFRLWSEREGENSRRKLEKEQQARREEQTRKKEEKTRKEEQDRRVEKAKLIESIKNEKEDALRRAQTLHLERVMAIYARRPQDSLSGIIKDTDQIRDEKAADRREEEQARAGYDSLVRTIEETYGKRLQIAESK